MTKISIKPPIHANPLAPGHHDIHQRVSEIVVDLDAAEDSLLHVCVRLEPLPNSTNPGDRAATTLAFRIAPEMALHLAKQLCAHAHEMGWSLPQEGVVPAEFQGRVDTAMKKPAPKRPR